MARGIVSDDSKDSLLEEIRSAFDYDTNEWREIRDEGKTDMLCCAGEIWAALDPGGKAQRDKAHRPMITADELNQYINQVINGVRSNQRAVKFAPVGNGASEEGAEFYADKMREIEYRSKAQIAYTTAFENAVQRGYGFCRVNTKYSTVPGQRFNQDIWIEAIPNPDLVLPDAEALSPDSSDMKRCVVYEPWPKAEFKRQFGEKATQTRADFTAEHMAAAPAWIKANTVLVAEHWKVKTPQRKLLLVQMPAPAQVNAMLGLQPPPKPIEVWEDEFLKGNRQGATILAHRMAEDRKVCQYLTNGLEILDEKDWPGKYIPIISCYGKVIYVDRGAGSKRVLVSMTRLARDPYMLYCYYRTQQAEMAGMIPKTPVQAYAGQMEGFEETWQKMNHEPVAYAYFHGKTEATGENILPPPSRLDYHAGEHLQALELCAEGARRAIQAAMATNFMPTQAQRRNEKSGKALDKIDEVAQRGSFHFNDHYDDMITHVGVLCEDLMDKIYDTDREVGIRKKDEQAVVMRINAPTQDEDGKPIQINTKGDYQVTVSTGPAFDSTRQAESEFADVLMETPFAPLIADLVVKLKGGGPVLEEIAERLTPPQFRKDKEGQPDPAQLLQAVQQFQAENDNLKKIASQLAMDLKTQKLKIESDRDIALAEIASRERIAASKDSTTVVTTEMKLSAQESIALMEAQLESIRSTLAGHEAEMQRFHEIGLAKMGHQQQLEAGQQAVEGEILTGEQANVNALEQAGVGHAQTLAQQAQAAKLAPKPTNGSA